MTGTIKRRKAFWMGVLYATTLVVIQMVALRRIFPVGVYPAKRLDAASQEIVQRALRMKAPKGVRFDHVTVVHGKDSMLYASAIINESDLERFLKSATFETIPREKSRADLRGPALPWWNFKAEEIQLVLDEDSGFGQIVVVISGTSLRVFIHTDGGRSGLPADFWTLFQ